MTRQPIKIAVLLPEAYGGGTLRGALSFAIQLHDGAKAAGDDVVVEFGFVSGANSSVQDLAFKSLRDRKISCRPMHVEIRPLAALVLVGARGRTPIDSEDRNILVFNDGISNFDDADYRFIISDRRQAAAEIVRRGGSRQARARRAARVFPCGHRPGYYFRPNQVRQ